MTDFEAGVREWTHRLQSQSRELCERARALCASGDEARSPAVAQNEAFGAFVAADDASVDRDDI